MVVAENRQEATRRGVEGRGVADLGARVSRTAVRRRLRRQYRQGGLFGVASAGDNRIVRGLNEARWVGNKEWSRWRASPKDGK